MNVQNSLVLDDYFPAIALKITEVVYSDKNYNPLIIHQIVKMKSYPMFYLFIDKYRQSELKERLTFTTSLEKDLASVENAVVSDLSNDYVKGTNNKLKMVKRPMYDG